MIEKVRLTQYSHGGGCGCKIAPNVLEEILKTNIAAPDNGRLLVGNHSKDDAAVYDLENGTALISTTDFFMPIVDDAFDFGRIASANAISDVYAMGGQPILAIAILGWPIGKIAPEVAQKIIEGSRSICREAGIPLAGGHSIDNPEPIFGLAVSGLVNIEHLKQNNTAREGDQLFLTKALGVGILSTAQKRGALSTEDADKMIAQLTTLNKIGAALGKINGVSAMTDVTGFGLLGHAIEMAEGSNLSATLYLDKVVIANGVQSYLAQGIMPGATKRNWESYGHKVRFENGINEAEARNILPDPQTNGGLLVAVQPGAVEEVVALFKSNGLDGFTTPIGTITQQSPDVVTVKQHH
ncbi:selenide, water dikinase SelD [Segetibacter sp. 3557_3]|uniref:selenide, water dikinase SelD n=1 Tax=Segetibacter sp. 3557_3 TaxID=2547429 RepID=UPI00105865F6|nr:selenide, water dikinase SelD [Segetibacter sp. 3557_3]TDH19720.1 selenide, water dikinase SelD [Segetibacter sp. 3557_3]